ncbi:hypothetical protein DICPUDRAFT_48016 [Dictyostelium purpureum]|uniref:AP complex subunit beta n=1 Tax=Dictyostelium purpureum TaxID=5786 RepID=F0ZMF1_DICPU|nr:uncharacterized protein DICPUDRAFT_48016 [Dictyostelium purpureum]EGC34888.1 hypothetical protein DICPUDRAFT_48016 [Dictyostelium purpureum]|eukprot:XP_003288580.1 hypothetical protein DICPUDRAFT_48016 [Dictyostelium purpureum]
MSDSKYFQTTKKGEIHELKEELLSQREDKKKEAVKKVIAAMTVGKDVSMLFTHVLNCMQTHNLELKKLVYLYVMNYAKNHPDRAILAVNTFQKDASDPNPLIRALAVRTMGCIRVDNITEHLCEPLRHALKDQDPYVRKTAAVCVAKLYDVNPDLVENQGFLNILNDLLGDSNPMVVANAVASLTEIDEVSKKEVFRIHSNNLNKLLAALNECTEWGQVFILNSLCKYTPKDSQEAESVCERVAPRLQHANSAVVLSAVKVLMKYMNSIQSNDVIRLLCKKMAPPLVTLLSKEPEIQFLGLRNINLIVQKRPEILQYEMKVFFCKYNDPIYVKMEKLEIMIMLANEKNIEEVLLEFKEYATEVDVEFVRKAVRAIGRCAIKIDRASERCIQVLLDLIQTKVNYVVQEAIIVIKDIFRKYPNKYEGIIATLCANLESLDEPEAKASMIWIIGEYAERIDNAHDLLNSFLEGFKDENSQVQLQLLTAIVKLFLKRPKDAQQMVQTVLNLSTQESDNPDLRDRGFVYWRLLSTDFEAAKAVVLSEKPLITDTTSHLDESLLNELILNISTLASVYHKPPETFVTKLKGVKPYQQQQGGQQQGGQQQQQQRSGNLIDLDLSDLGGALPSYGQNSNGYGSPQQQFNGNPNDLSFLGGGNQGQAQSPINKVVVFGGDRSQSIQISGAFTRYNGRINLELNLFNTSPNVMSKFKIQFYQNCFGISPAEAILTCGAIEGGQNTDVSIPISCNGQLFSPFNPVIDMAMMVLPSQEKFLFKMNFPFHCLLTETGRLDRENYLSMWKSIPESNERSVEIQVRLPHVDVESILRRLNSKNIFEIVRKKAPNQEISFLSCKTENSVYILIELAFNSAPNQRTTCRCSSKTTSPDIIQLFEHNLDLLINNQI